MPVCARGSVVIRSVFIEEAVDVALPDDFVIIVVIRVNVVSAVVVVVLRVVVVERYGHHGRVRRSSLKPQRRRPQWSMSGGWRHVSCHCKQRSSARRRGSTRGCVPEHVKLIHFIQRRGRVRALDIARE